MQKKLSTTAIVLIVVAAVLVLAVAAAALYVVSMGNKTEIYPNIYAGGINIGGMSKEEAIAAIDQNLADSYGKSTLTVDLGDTTIEITPDVVNADVNAEQVVEDAYAFGRGGDIFSRAATYLKAQKASVTYTVNAGLTIDEESIRALIAQKADELYCEAVESKAEEHTDEDYIEVTIGTAGRSLDAEALSELVIAAIYENNFETIEFAYDTQPYAALDLTRLYNEIYTPVEDAYYDAETHEIVEEQIGYGFDLAAANQQIAMAADGEVIRIALEEMLPEETKAHLEEIYFADVIGECETSGLGSYNRATNITLACEAINGTVLA
ncbi:MAG: peptidoglycan binding domain-containing protein, partial [Oscillospiraceae bacterium]|nr:peptidoglycan binding domain-containing protein [Oscillospiraceae bacterium]